jgi:hypothetical protein
VKNVMRKGKNPLVERRQIPRYLFECDLSGTELPLLASEAELTVFRGRVQNIGSGGLCFLTDRAIEVAQLIRCDLRIDSVPTAIRLVMQVRWSQSLPWEFGYAVGTSFLI